ncbi:ependymin-related protein 1-like [Saccostrea echinata]|uniref:ependymin-related protein 1-like n=1 Tax=Saccostrea echinata TaxID=191078 RepID=UPI002A7F5684|nr:ependymin-related protein 1-like [Saccostrea echinata]
MLLTQRGISKYPVTRFAKYKQGTITVNRVDSRMKPIFLRVLTVPLLCHLALGCCTPEQWSGDMGFLVGTNNNGQGGLEVGKVKLFYDAKNTKIASFSERVVNGKLFKGVMVQNFEEGVQYTVVNGVCNTTRLARKGFTPACVPKGSKKVSNTHLGTSTDSLDVSSYEIPIKQYNTNAYFLITNKLCIPVGDTITAGTEKAGFMASVGYTGFEPGIKDPRVFDKPRECSSTIEEGEIDLFERFGLFNHKTSSLFR